MDENALENRKDKLQQHVISTYRWLRLGLGLLALIFPILLTGVGWFWYGVPLQGSMSAYYLAQPDPRAQDGTWRHWLAERDFPGMDHLLFFLDQTEVVYPMRSWFVGTLFVIGVFLILYKGFSTSENWLLNLAGLFSLGVAIFPTGYDCDPECLSITLHGVFAVLMFVFTALVAFYCARETLDILQAVDCRQESTARRSKYFRPLFRGADSFKWSYRVAGGCMVFLPAVVLVFHGYLGFSNIYILVAEWLAMWSFAAYWLIKTLELQWSLAEKLLAERKRAGSTLADPYRGAGLLRIASGLIWPMPLFVIPTEAIMRLTAHPEG